MSRAQPVPLADRLRNYNFTATRESQLTPRQRRRAWHKAYRSGERGGGELARLYLGRKGRPTPRQRAAR